MDLEYRAAPGSPIRSPNEAGAVRLLTATDGRDVLENTPSGWEVDAPWLWWLGPAGGDGTGGPFGNPLDASSSSTTPPSGNLAAVNRCTSLISDTIAGLPWDVIRGDFERLPRPDWISDPQAQRIDGRIVGTDTLWSCRLSAVEFWSQFVTAALWFGNSFVYVPVRDSAGAPKPPLWQLHPNDVTIADGEYWVGETALPRDSVIHLRGLGPYFDGSGRGVLTTFGRELGLASAVGQYAAGVFQSGVPAGYLKSSAPSMTQDQADELKARWLAQHGGARRSIAVLNATTDFHAVAISPVDAQLNSAREWSLRDIALAFGVPPYSIGAPADSSTYANVESRMIELRTFTLLPWQRRVEATLDAQLPRGTGLKIRSDALLRADTATRYAAYKNAIDAGWLLPDEVRTLEDLPPLETKAAL